MMCIGARVREAFGSAIPPPRKVPARVSPALGPYPTVMRAWLVADREVPRKQRHTATPTLSRGPGLGEP